VNIAFLKLAELGPDVGQTASIGAPLPRGHEYRSLFENALEGMFRATPDGRLLSANPALVSMLGYESEAQLLGDARLTDWHAGGVALEHIVNTLSAHGTLRGAAIDVRRVDGSVRNCLLSVRTVRDEGGQPLALEGILADISERRRLEDALRTSEERFRLLAEAAFEGVGVSENLYWLDVSQQFADMLGYTREELIGTHVSMVLAPESIERVLHNVAANYEGAYEVTELRKDGSRFPAEVRGRSMTVGERTLRVSVVRDITQQKRVLEELELQQQRLRGFAAALAVAEECDRRRTATELHDEIGQALAAVKLKLDALEQDVVTSGDTDIVRDVSGMLSEIIARARTIMTELSPPGIYDLRFEMALEWLAKRTWERDGVECRVERVGESMEIAPEVRVMLFAAARELLRNVVCHAGIAHATMRIVCAPDRIELAVLDAGVGFDPQALTELPRSTQGFGLFGIGERVRAFGGVMLIESAPGRGTHVSLSLPHELEPLRAPAAADLQPAVPPRSNA
jgi:PAS domain S-box-containing protein